MLHEMTVTGLAIDPSTNAPILILSAKNDEFTVPIWIGLMEAASIASVLQGIEFDRPMTHDLFKNFIERMNVKVTRIEICDLKNNTYYAQIHFIHNGRELTVDARPSDALALSLRVKAPIFVSEEVISNSSQVDLKAEAEDKSEKGKKWQEILERLNPEDFGKYRM